MKYTDQAFYDKRYTAEERADKISKYGVVPDSLVFPVTIDHIMGWGFPMWQVYEEVFKRNSHVGSVTEEEDVWIWKLLHVLLVRRVLARPAPGNYKDPQSIRAWRQEYLQEASGWMWQVLYTARDKKISPANVIFFTVSRVHNKSLLRSLNQHVSDITEAVSDRVSIMGASATRSVPDQVASKIDHEETMNTIDGIVLRRLSKRLPESLFPGMRKVIRLAMSGSQKIAWEYKWVLDFVTVHRRIALSGKSR